MDPYLGEIKLWALTYAPTGWALCNGAILQVAQNQALFSLIGNKYGGNGTTTFALPDLRGRVPVHCGSLQNGSNGGEESVTLTANQVPQHNHPVGIYNDSGDQLNGLGRTIAKPASLSGGDLNLFATGTLPNTAINSATVDSQGANGLHPNMQPYLTLNYFIATQGIYPPRN